MIRTIIIITRFGAFQGWPKGSLFSGPLLRSLFWGAVVWCLVSANRVPIVPRGAAYSEFNSASGACTEAETCRPNAWMLLNDLQSRTADLYMATAWTCMPRKGYYYNYYYYYYYDQSHQDYQRPHSLSSGSSAAWAAAACCARTDARLAFLRGVATGILLLGFV